MNKLIAVLAVGACLNAAAASAGEGDFYRDVAALQKAAQQNRSRAGEPAKVPPGAASQGDFYREIAALRARLQTQPVTSASSDRGAIGPRDQGDFFRNVSSRAPKQSQTVQAQTE